MTDQAISFVSYSQRDCNGHTCKLRCSSAHIILCYFFVYWYARCSKSA